MTRLAASEPAWAQITDSLSPSNGGGMPPNGSSVERDGWQVIIDGRLAEWEKNPDVLEDEGVTPPSAATIQLAIQTARKLRDAGLPAPQRTAATGDGGITFARQEGPLLSTIEVAPDGTVELVVLRDCQLLSRHPLR